jgi:putative redox protein
MLKSRVKFVEDMQFVGTNGSGHAIVMDAPQSVGGNNTGSKPSELLLSALGGCTGMDVISILRKKKQDVRSFEMAVSGEMAEKHPRMLISVHIEYFLSGKNLSDEAVKRAIELSQGKYCSVGFTIGKAAKITYSYKIIRED